MDMNIEFCLSEFDATKIVTWNCNVAKSINISYYMILGKYLLSALDMDIKFSENTTVGGDGPYKRCSVTMVDFRTYELNQ